MLAFARVAKWRSNARMETNGSTCHTAGFRVGSKGSQMVQDKLVFGSVVKVPRWFRTIEMTRRLGNWCRLEVRAMVQFLWAKNVSGSDIHGQIVEVFGGEAMSRQHVAKWCLSFQSGRQVTLSSPRSEVTTDIPFTLTMFGFSYPKGDKDKIKGFGR
ncbi:hypothetical protein TNCV_4611071 [Trichonephila clavipes]|nr:hypothetical protein TNCV_4611071 [Trichonephila clavipes]